MPSVTSSLESIGSHSRIINYNTRSGVVLAGDILQLDDFRVIHTDSTARLIAAINGQVLDGDVVSINAQDVDVPFSGLFFYGFDRPG